MDRVQIWGPIYGFWGQIEDCQATFTTSTPLLSGPVGGMHRTQLIGALARRRFRVLSCLAEAIRVGSLQATVGHGYQLLRLTLDR
jgi:hypothetical protein